MIFFDALQCRSFVLESVYDKVLYMARKVHAHSWPLVVRTTGTSSMMVGWLVGCLQLGKRGCTTNNIKAIVY